MVESSGGHRSPLFGYRPRATSCMMPSQRLNGGWPMDSASLTEAYSANSDFRQLFDQSLVPMALVSIGDEPRVVAASKGFLHFLKMRRAAVVDHLLDDVFARDDSSELAKAARRCLSTSRPLRVEVEQRSGANRR